ncbi:uncharacterized protein LOC126014322 [Suncus etruscus]|uniref:uncharacterized protein LOC126014322 n=1 Tax=Suncus etruscus TaxID=109475 RepID=UPI00210F9EEB|nr:uncharacterized protein LOC126014322 [Suncus etruscus]
METEFKKILLQKGLEKLSDYQFRTVKSLLASELELSEKMTEDYDRIKLANRMFICFPGVTCIVKLIDILKDDPNDPNIQNIVSSLRKAKQNGNRDPHAPLGSLGLLHGPASRSATKKLKAGAEPLQKKRKQDEVSTSTQACSSDVSGAPQDTADTPMVQLATSVSQTTPIKQPDTTRISPATPSSVNMASQTKETPAIPERAEDRGTLAKDSVTVKVLKRSQPFSYESTEQGTESMFHALVATTNHFFWVKVLDMALRKCFTEKFVLLISGHSENRGILEVSRSSSVFLAHDQIQVPNSVLRKAREIPKIAFIKNTPGIFVYGCYELIKKTENKKNTVYEIRDETGNINVKGSGQCHGLSCEAGDKLHLFCFRLRTVDHKPILLSEKHSLIQVEALKVGESMWAATGEVWLHSTSCNLGQAERKRKKRKGREKGQWGQENMPGTWTVGVHEGLNYESSKPSTGNQPGAGEHVGRGCEPSMGIEPHPLDHIPLLPFISNKGLKTDAKKEAASMDTGKGLEMLSNYQFREVKSLLVGILNLTSKMLEDDDRIKIADRMFARFPGAKCVAILIDVIKDNRELENLTKSLKQQMEEVTRRLQSAKNSKKKRQLDRVGPLTPEHYSSSSGTPQGAAEEPVAQKRKKFTQVKSEPQGSPASQNLLLLPVDNEQLNMSQHLPSPVSTSTLSSESSVQNPRPQAFPKATTSSLTLWETPVVVKVLQVSKPFPSKTPGSEERILFHATVATTSEYFPMKVFIPELRARFLSNRVLCISRYIKNKGFLEIREPSSITEEGPEKRIKVPSIVLDRAKKMPKICILHTLSSGTVISGFFTLCKKSAKRTNTIYNIWDNTGNMDVVGQGQWHNLPCREGDKLWLFGFRIRKSNQKNVLISEEDSWIQVTKMSPSRNVTLPEASADRMTPTINHTPQSSSSSSSQTKSLCPVLQAPKAHLETTLLHCSDLLTEIATCTSSTQQTPSAIRWAAQSSSSILLPAIRSCSHLTSPELKVHPDLNSLFSVINMELIFHPAITSWFSVLCPELILQPDLNSFFRVISMEFIFHPATTSWFSVLCPELILQPDLNSLFSVINMELIFHPAITSWFSVLCPELILQPAHVHTSTISASMFLCVSRLVATFQEEGLQTQRKVVMVLSAMEPFTYRRFQEDSYMFHATVATQSLSPQIIHVKVFHEPFKAKFIRGNIVVLSNYIGHRGFLEVYEKTSVEDTGVTMKVPYNLIRKARATPKIRQLLQKTPGTLVNGVFTVRQKIVRDPCVYYQIQDNTGVMEVLVFGHLSKIPCESGDRVELTCFELGENQLRSVIHSFLKVRRWEMLFSQN